MPIKVSGMSVAGLLLASATILVVVAHAQIPKRSDEEIKAAFSAHNGDFDYLLGDWEFRGHNRTYGDIHGFWSAVRLADGNQIMDEYRVVGDNGDIYYSSVTLRAYNAVLDRWELISMEKETGLQNFGTGHRVGMEMRIEQKFGEMRQNPSSWRIRYHDIQENRFLWSADRSVDGGKTWDVSYQELEARRIGPSRSIGPLVPARPQIGISKPDRNSR